MKELGGKLKIGSLESGGRRTVMSNVGAGLVCDESDIIQECWHFIHGLHFLQRTHKTHSLKSSAKVYINFSQKSSKMPP